MHRLTMLSIVATLVVSSCAGDDADSTTTRTAAAPSESSAVDADAEAEAPAATDVAAPTDTEPPATDVAESTAAPTAVTEPVTEDDLVLFIAAAERSLEGTSQESAVFDDPEIYIALGQASCDRFTSGEDFEQIAIDLLDGIDTDDSDDETRLVGAILGAATQTLCPEHADEI